MPSKLLRNATPWVEIANWIEERNSPQLLFRSELLQECGLKSFLNTKILVIKVSLSAENKMKDITMDNEVGNSAKLFHLECLRCSILKVSLDSMCQCLDEQGKCEDGMKCGICSCRLCRYTRRWMLVLLTHWQCNVCPWGPTPAHWPVTIALLHQCVPRCTMCHEGVISLVSIITDNIVSQKAFDFRHLRPKGSLRTFCFQR